MAARISPEDYFKASQPIDSNSQQTENNSLPQSVAHYDNSQQMMMFYTIMALAFVVVFIIALAYLRKRD